MLTNRFLAPSQTRFSAHYGSFQTSEDAMRKARQLGLTGTYGIITDLHDPPDLFNRIFYPWKPYSLVTGNDLNKAAAKSNKAAAKSRSPLLFWVTKYEILSLFDFANNYRRDTHMQDQLKNALLETLYQEPLSKPNLKMKEAYVSLFNTLLTKLGQEPLSKPNPKMNQAYVSLFKTLLGDNQQITLSFIFTAPGAKKPHGHVVQIQKENENSLLVTTTDYERPEAHSDGKEINSHYQFRLNPKTGDFTCLDHTETTSSKHGVKRTYQHPDKEKIEPLYHLAFMCLIRANKKNKIIVKTQKAGESWQTSQYNSGYDFSKAFPDVKKTLKTICNQAAFKVDTIKEFIG